MASDRINYVLVEALVAITDGVPDRMKEAFAPGSCALREHVNVSRNFDGGTPVSIACSARSGTKSTPSSSSQPRSCPTSRCTPTWAASSASGKWKMA